ncbi:MAG: cupin domain-containing protein [Fimbriimonas sp.]
MNAANPPIILNVHRQPAKQVLGVAVDILADAAQTGGQFTAYRCVVPPEVGPPPHRHEGFDEAFYVVAGLFEILADGQTHRAGPGSYVYIPRGTVHTFRNVGETPGEFLGTATPAGHEDFFHDADRLVQAGPLTIEGILDVCARNGIEVVPPQ